MASRSDNLIVLAVFGVAAYIAYTVIKKLPQLTQPASDALAAWWVKMTAQPPMVPQGSVYFPDGSYVLVAAIPGGVSFDNASQTARFTYQGGQWVIPGGHDVNGNWAAVPLSAYQAAPSQFGATQLPVEFGIENPTGGWS